MADRETAAELFEIRARGLMAMALDVAGQTPTTDQWDMMRGARAITLRDLGELAFQTGVRLDFAMVERVEAGETAGLAALGEGE